MASNIDGSVIIDVNLNVKDAEKELSRLKGKVLRLEDSLHEKQFKKSALEESLSKANTELEALKNSAVITGRKLQFSPDAIERMTQLNAEIPKIEAEIRKCDQAIADTNLKLDVSKLRYGEIAEEANRLRREEEARANEKSKPGKGSISSYDDRDWEKEALDRRARADEMYQKILQKLKAEYQSVYSELAPIIQSTKKLLSSALEPVYGKMSPAVERIKSMLSSFTASVGEKLGVDLRAELEYGKKNLEIGFGGMKDFILDTLDQIVLKVMEAKDSLSYGFGGLLERVKSIPSTLKSAFSGNEEEGGEGGGILSGLSSVLAVISPKIAAILKVLEVVKSVLNTVKTAFDKVKNAAVAASKEILSMSSVAGSAIVNFGKKTASVFGEEWKNVLGFVKNMNAITKLTDMLSKKFRYFSRMLKRTFMTFTIMKGLRAIRKQITTYLSVNAELSTSLSRLKGVFLTAFQPIYDAALPALISLINVITKAVAVLNEFTAVLFGTTAKKAQQNASALHQQTKEMNAAGSAAEEAAKSFAGFDEINQLDTSKKGGGGGGGASTELGPSFDYEYEDTVFDSWGEAFSAFLDKLLDGIPKLRAKLLDFAKWLNDFAQKLYDMFTFPGVKEKVEQLGRDLADALNELVNAIEWNLLGKALGAGLNLALQFLTEFLYEFDWINLGRKLAEFVNGLVSEIDWYDFGRLLWAGFKISLETLAGFLLGLDMPQLAEAASNIIKGFFDSMTETIEKIPWGDIGKKIAEFLTNLDWYGMLSSVTSAIAAGIKAAVSALSGFLSGIVPEIDRIAKEIVTALIEFFRDKVEWKDLANTIGDGIKAALRFIVELLDPELFAEIGKAIGDFLVGLDWPRIIGGLANVLAAAIGAAVAAVKGFLSAVKPHLKEIAEGIAQKINEFVEKVEWGDLGKTIHDGIDAALDFLLTILDNLNWDEIGQAVVDFLTELQWGDLLAKWGSVVGKAIGGALKGIDLSDALSLGGDIIAGMLKGMINKFNESGGPMGWLKRHVFSPFISSFASLFNMHSPSKVMAEQGGFIIAGLLQGISETWRSIPDFFREKVDELKQSLSEAWENIKSTAKEKWDAIKENLVTKFNEIHEKAGEKFGEIKEKIGETWESVKGSAKGKWEEIKNTLSDKFEEILKNAKRTWNDSKSWWKGEPEEAFKKEKWKRKGQDVADGLSEGLDSGLSKVKGWSRTVRDEINSAIAASREFTKIKPTYHAPTYNPWAQSSYSAYASAPDISTFQIPRLAQGAVIPANREFLAVLGDQKRGTNVEAPLATIEQALENVLSRRGNGGGATQVTVNFTGSLSQLARLLQPEISVETQRIGTRLVNNRA